MKAIASSKILHVRVKKRDKDEFVQYGNDIKYTIRRGQSKALCELVGRTKIIGIPRYANRDFSSLKYVLEKISCSECLKELALRKLDPERDISDFEKEIEDEKFDQIVRSLKILFDQKGGLK